MDPELLCAIFLSPLPWTKKFCWKTINIIFIYFLAPFILENLTKMLATDPELWGSTIFEPKMFYVSQFFSQKPISKPGYFYSFLSTSKKSKSDVKQSMKYWQLRKTETSFGESIFGNNLRTTFSPSMGLLQDFKHFHFTPFPDKTKDSLFLKC